MKTGDMALGETVGCVVEQWALNLVEDPETEALYRFLAFGEGKPCPGPRCGAMDRLKAMSAS